MNKEQAQEQIEKCLVPNDSLVGFFIAQQSFKIWLVFLIGPLAMLSMKSYFVAVTEKGICFHRLSLFGKFANSDFFEFSEIENVKIGKGLIQRPMSFEFRNGRKMKIKAQLKGVEKVAKLTETVQQHIEKNIAVL